MQFDAYDLCSSELQKKLQPVRDIFEADEEAKAEAQIAGRQEGGVKQMKVDQKPKEVKEWEAFDFPDGEFVFLQKTKFIKIEVIQLL